jgi:hypothetical protein
VDVPEKRTVKFKVGRLMKQKLGLTGGDAGVSGAHDHKDGSDKT